MNRTFIHSLRLLIGVAALSSTASAQFEQDPTAGIVHQPCSNCNWDYDGARRGDTTTAPEPVPDKPNQKIEKRVRYIRAGTGNCWSSDHRESCPCPFEALEELECWYERTITEETYPYVESTDVIPHVPFQELPGVKQALTGLTVAKKAALQAAGGRTKTRTVYGDWSALPPVHTFKDLCLCDKQASAPGTIGTTGRIPGYKYPVTGRPRVPNPTTGGPSVPPPFTERPPGSTGGRDIPQPGTGPTTGGSPNVPPDQLPVTPICQAGNDIPEGRFHWDYKRDHEWAESVTPTYVSFSGPPTCVPTDKQDRYKWIRKVTMTGSLKGAASCGAKPDGHNGHPECSGGCGLGAYPTMYEISWFRTLTFEPVNGTITCSVGLPKPWDEYGSVELKITGTIGWKPVYGDWEVEVGSGTSGEGASCGCEGGEEPPDEEETPPDEEETPPDDDSTQGGG